MHKKHLGVFLFLACLLGHWCVQPLHALITTIGFEGFVDKLPDFRNIGPGGGHAPERPSIDIGGHTVLPQQRIQGWYSFDTATPDSFPIDDRAGFYDYTPSFDLQMAVVTNTGNLNFQVRKDQTFNSGIHISHPNQLSFPSEDRYSVQRIGKPQSLDYDNLSLSVQFINRYPGPLHDDKLHPEPPKASDFTWPIINMSGSDYKNSDRNFDIQGLVTKTFTVPDFGFPLRSNDPIYLNTEAGGKAYDGIDDPNHLPATGYYSMDFDVNTGMAQVVATAPGTVVDKRIIQRADGPYQVVTIYHGDGYFSEYAEFFDSTSEVLVSKGQVVSKGTVIGTLKAVGKKHLHYQVKYNQDYRFYEDHFDAVKFDRSFFDTGLSKQDNLMLHGVRVDKHLFDEEPYKLPERGGQRLLTPDVSKPIPEPATIWLFGIGLAGTVLKSRKNQRSASPKFGQYRR